MTDKLSFADESGWMNIRTFEPDQGVDIIVKTPWGIRRAIHSVQPWGPRYVFTDCTHPMQNVCLSQYDIQGWRFARAEDTANVRLKQNHWQLQKDGEQILSKVKPMSFLRNLLLKFKP